MSETTSFMRSGLLSSEVHGVLDYPLAAALIAGPLAIGFDSDAATTVALIFGAGALVLAIGTAWATGIVKLIPPLVHGYADITVTLALIGMPFFADEAAALAFYLIVGAGGLMATLATRFE